MSDVEWDADDFDPDNVAQGQAAAEGTDRWAGEDEGGDIKDSWDDEGEEGDKTTSTGLPKRKKKSLKEIIAEKEAKKQEELERRKQEEEEAKRKMTPEERIAEKLKQQHLQEDSDFLLAQEAFGTSNDTEPQGKLDTFDPITKEEFDEFARLLKDKLVQSERSTFYVGFLESLFRDLAANLEVDDAKRLSSSMNAIYNEKTKAQKGLKGKKKSKGKANLNPGKDGNYEDYQPDAFEYDDFM